MTDLPINQIVQGDCIDVMRTLPDGCVHCAVTSPPYWGLRDYGIPATAWPEVTFSPMPGLPVITVAAERSVHGLETTILAYVAHEVLIFREVHRVLRDDATCFVNLGDSYTSGGRRDFGPNTNNGVLKDGILPARSPQPPDLKPKDLCGIAWRVAFALQADGWYLRQDIIWHKPNPMPESITDRCTKAHEYIFLLSKTPRYYYDAEAIKEGVAGNTHPQGSRGGQKLAEQGNGIKANKSFSAAILNRTKADCPTSRNKRSVWTIPTAPYKEAHFACVDDETEALTPTGWRRQSELIDGCSIAAYNPDLGVLNWQPATFHRYDFDGELVSIEKRDSSQRLTPNHRCLVKRRNGQIAVVEAKNLMASMQVLTTATLVLEEGIGVGVGFAALLGWYVTEGECKRGNIVRINQSQSANPTHVSEIRRILDSLSAEYKECVRERIWRGRPSVEVAFNVRGAIASKIDDLCSDKMPKWAWVNWPLADVWAFLNAVIDGDGHRRKDGRRCIIQKNREFIDVVQAMTLRLGYRSQIGKHGDGWAVYLTSGQWLTLRGTNGAYHEIQRDRYSGTVWCPSVASTFWLARRNGKTFITGNTFPPDLVRPCIRAGTSQKGCCPECGAPWERVTQKIKTFQSGSGRSGNEIVGKQNLAAGEKNSTPDIRMGPCVEARTIGWKPGCDCYEPKWSQQREVLVAELRIRNRCRSDRKRRQQDLANRWVERAVRYAELHLMPREHARFEALPGIALDPFGGSGTTGAVAAQEGRNYILCELNPKYVEMARTTRLHEAETGVPAAEARNGQMGLFDEGEL